MFFDDDAIENNGSSLKIFACTFELLISRSGH